MRESKNLSQGELEKRTGLLRCYTSRVENGHTVPTIETLEKYAQAMGIPLYEIFYEGEGTPESLRVPQKGGAKDSIGRDEWDEFVHQLGRVSEQDRRILFFLARKMAVKQKLPLRSGRKGAAAEREG